MNTFINLVKKFFIGEGIKRGVRALGEVNALIKTSLLLALDPLTGLWAPVSLFCFVKLAKKLLQGLC